MGVVIPEFTEWGHTMKSNLVVLLACVLFNHASAQSPEKSFYAYLNLLDEPNKPLSLTATQFAELMSRAKKAGYSAAVISDYYLADIDLLRGAESQSGTYLTNIKVIRDAAEAHQIELIPEVMSVGSSGQILLNNPNLAEGIPVVDCEYEVRNEGGLVAVVKDQANVVKHGGFEATQVEIAAQFSVPESVFDISSDTSGGSGSSVVFSNPNDLFLLSQDVRIQPKLQYQWSFELKADGLTEDPDDPMILYSIVSAFDTKHGRRKLHRVGHDLKMAEGKWHRYVVSLNSFEYDKVDITIGLENATGGTVILDNVALRQSQAVNLIRREDLPVTIKNAAGEVLYEVDDYLIEQHPNFGEGGHYAPDEAIAPIKLTDNTNLKVGDTIRVSYFHAQLPDAEAHRVCCSLWHPEVVKLHSDQVQLLNDILKPQRWFINHDEIRAVGHEPTVTEQKISPGVLLRQHLIKCLEVIKKKGDNKPVILNSDMYDPFHNATAASHTDSYYPMVNGSFTGSWLPISEHEMNDPPTITVWNWNMANAQPAETFLEQSSSFAHFRGLGYPQIIGGYYDVSDNRAQSQIDSAFSMARVHAGVVSGVCYYTALNNYDHLERFAEAADKILGK